MAEQEEVRVVSNTGEIARFSDGSTVIRTNMAANPVFATISTLIVGHGPFQSIFRPGVTLSEAKEKWDDPQQRTGPPNDAASAWSVPRQRQIECANGWPKKPLR